jgi:hypothetical protein
MHCLNWRFIACFQYLRLMNSFLDGRGRCARPRCFGGRMVPTTRPAWTVRRSSARTRVSGRRLLSEDDVAIESPGFAGDCAPFFLGRSLSPAWRYQQGQRRLLTAAFGLYRRPDPSGRLKRPSAAQIRVLHRRLLSSAEAIRVA